MQELKPDPASSPNPASGIAQKTPGFTLLGQLHSLFLRKADSKFEEARQLLKPPMLDLSSPADSLDTGKLNKLINYIKGGLPSFVLICTFYGQIH